MGCLILLAVAVLVAFEYWRLSSPETVRLRQSWEFQTPNGKRTISDVVELQQMGAVPYLPGGERGPSKAIGNIPVSIELSGTRYYISSDPKWLIGNSIRAGRSSPPLSLGSSRNAYDTGFIRRLRRSKARIDVPLERVTQYMWVGDRSGPFGEIAGARVRLPDFETAHPGFRLQRISYEVTDDPLVQRP